MNLAQRIQMRRSLATQDFRRTAHTDDLTGIGDYTETWTHPDGTTIEIKWAPRSSVTHLLIDTGRANNLTACDEPFANGQPGSANIDEVTCGACLALFPPRPRVLTRPGGVQDAPGMYDEPDHGLSFPLPLSDDENRL